MKTTLFAATVVALLGWSPLAAQESPRSNPAPPADQNTLPANEPKTQEPQPAGNDNKQNDSQIKPFTAEEQQRLLASRVSGGMENSFGQFANMFLVFSRLQLGVGVGLMTSDKEIAKSPLESPFPASYKPTLRELLDAIAMQTSSDWKYDPSDKYLNSEVEHKTPVEGLAMFEFTPRKEKREKPFEVTLAEGWKAIDNGHWMMYVPPSFPVGMDVYEMGTYSKEDPPADAQFANSIRAAVALEWAQRVNENAKPEDILPAKAGEYEALYYEAMIPSQLNKDIRWRQWVFMVEDRCFFIVSTILPELEEKIYPDVKSMVASFRLKSK